MAQGSEEPPFLRVGTEVSAKYRGAFCEASIKTVKKHVKCKIQYKDNSTATLTDDVVKGDLKIGSDVVVKTLDGRLMDGVIIKLTDASTYTVVFDDGDERTLRRTSLCLKGGRHFNESETLDHLPLTDPENFGTPVIQNGKKRKKRRPSSQQSSFEDGDSEKEEGSPLLSKKKCLFNESILGKVVIVERGARRKSHWFPALGVSPSQENLSYIKSKDQCLARSFKDGNYHVINIRDTKEFNKDQEPVSNAMKSDNRTNKPGIERAIAYLETGRVPSTWEGSKSEVITYDTDDETKRIPLRMKKPVFSDDDNDDSTDDDSEKEEFVEKLQHFMEKQGTPIVRNPVLGNQDLDLHKLYLLVMESGGMEEVTKKQEWRSIYSKMGIAIMPPSASHHIKMAYKKYLHPFELHQADCRTIKDSDEDKPSNKKEKPTIPGRARLERRSSSKNIDKPSPIDKKTKSVSTDLGGKPNNTKPVLPNKPRRGSTTNKGALKQSSSPICNKPASKPSLQASTTPNKPDKLPLSSQYSTSANKQASTPTGKSKALISKQSSKASTPDSHKDPLHEHKDIYTEYRNGTVLKQDSEEARRNYKHEDSLESDIDVDEEVLSPDSELAVDVVNSPGCMSDTSESRSDTRSDFGGDEAFECSIGDKIQVKYGRGRNRRMYEAKVVTVDPDAEEGLLYLIHYTGWNIRYDEWISPDRIIGKSNKVSKKKGPPSKEVSKNKCPPKQQGKQFIRSQSKRGTKSPSPASPGDSDVKAANGIKHREPSPPPQQGSPSPAKQGSPSPAKQATINGATTRRTRSERNSISSNGLDEALKSPSSKRRQKSLTPEPEQSNSAEISNENQAIKCEVTGEAQQSQIEDVEMMKEEEKMESLDDDSEECTDQKAEAKTNELKCHEKVNYNSKLRPWSKLPNGIINYSSSESGSPEHYATENDPEPPNKKVKIEKELGKDEMKKLLISEVEGKEPIAAPHSQGSSSSDNQGTTHEDRQKSSSPGDSEQKASSSENNGGNKSNSSDAENSKEEKTDDKEETKTVKKEGDHRGKRHRKKRERKRQRHHSVNENSNDGCSSNASPSSKSSPTRPKISFNADLESIKSMEDGSERIRLLQLKIKEMRKLYGSLKAEVASIDRRRKKLKKKKEESASHDSKSNCVSSPATVECR